MKTYRAIRYDFRPASYWDDTDPLHAILRNVKGENRRRMILSYAAQDRLEDLDEALLKDEVDDSVRESLGRIHPSFMGGEYLPEYFPGEIEIARICLQSTTGDVISLRAYPTPSGKIGYRVVDEYEATFTLPIRESDLPLTLRELVRQLDKGTLDDHGFPDGGLSLGYNNLNAESDDVEQLRHFTRISSGFYRQLVQHFEHVFDDWVTGFGASDCDRSEEEGTP